MEDPGAAPHALDQNGYHRSGRGPAGTFPDADGVRVHNVGEDCRASIGSGSSDPSVGARHVRIRRQRSRHPSVEIDGEVKELAIVKPGRQQSEFVDPANPDAGVIVWEGNWRILEPVRQSAWAWGNYTEAWNFISFPRLLYWTLLYAVVTMVGAVGSSAFVAYGFSRFKFPFRNTLFIVLIGTIILPPVVVLIPRYFVFTQIGWTGTWLPV